MASRSGATSTALRPRNDRSANNGRAGVRVRPTDWLTSLLLLDAMPETTVEQVEPGRANDRAARVRRPLDALNFFLADVRGGLPIRGLLYTLSDNPFWLVGVQLLDGVGAGIYGAIFPIVVADLMRGTGRFNVAQGVVITAHGIGAALSTTLAGLVIVHAGYSAAFITLGGAAAIGAVVFLFAMPETRGRGPAISPS
jgi:MFS transporter